MAYFLNADGRLIHESAPSTKTHSATQQGQVLSGTAASETFWGHASLAARLVGGAGDDVYYVKNPRTGVVEQAGGGVDTIVTWMNYRLPDHVENLSVSGDRLYAHGNALDNIVSGGAGSQTINGFAGNDILRGGAGADTFVVARGNGSDVILDFQAGADGDAVRLQGTDFLSFEAVRAAMTQVGSDVVLALGGDETLIFRNQTIAAFEPANIKAMIDLSASRAVFADEFDALSLFARDGGTWKTTYYYGDRTLPANAEREFYVDPAWNGLGLDPFAIADGALVITAERASDALKPMINNLDYTSGMISSEQSFSMQYGYFEMRAELPAGKGLWPAFWLLPVNGDWPPELDVMEMIGSDTNAYYVSAHSKAGGSNSVISAPVATSDLSTGFHTYGVDWQADTITWYFDGVAVQSIATPADMHQPMYMIANLAVGGGWPGNPDANTAFPAEMTIDWIRAYQRPVDHVVLAIPEDWARIDPARAFASLDATGARTTWSWKTTMAPGEEKLVLSGEGARHAVGNDLDNYIAGSDGQYNEIDGGRGNDVLRGNAGIDVFVIRNGAGNDTILDFSNAAGNTDKIRLDGFHFTHFDDVRPWLFRVGDDTMLRLDEDQAVLFKNLSPDALRPEQFVFVNTVAPPEGARPAGPVGTVPELPAVPAPDPARGDLHAASAAEANALRGSAGIDTLHYSGTEAVTLGVGIENAVATGAGARITGNGLDNTIVADGPGYARLSGGAGADVLRAGNAGAELKGGTGDDRLEGGRGVDYLVGGAGADTFVFRPGDLALTGARDQIQDFEGAGAPGGDVLRFEGFGERAILRFQSYHQVWKDGGPAGFDETKQYYAVQDADGYHGTILVQVATKQLLGPGDYEFV